MPWTSPKTDGDGGESSRLRTCVQETPVSPPGQSALERILEPLEGMDWAGG